MPPQPINEKEIFNAARQIAAADARTAWLEHACANHPELLARIKALLAAHERIDSFLEPPGAIQATQNQPLLERPGMQIGPYKLMEQIGEGGMGLVFVAEQHEPVRRKVALKLIKPGMDTRDVIARFEAERQALALMDHPSIARVLDAGYTASGRPYFVMELVKGVPITQYCDANRLLPDERLELFTQVCYAVQHAHQKGIIHRDIKPTNVLVASHDGTPVIKVIDFGVAKAIGPQLTEKTIYTQFTQMVGTPLYMSPEQAGQSSLDIDTRTDIYALGVLLYELLTGTTPFDKERLRTAGYDEVRRIIREEEPAKPSTRISTLGPTAATVSANRGSDPKRLRQLIRGELDWIVMKAVEKDRNRRYETASACAADVQRYLRDEPVEACPPSALYRFRKFARRNRAVLVTALAVTLAVLLTVAGLTASTLLIARQQQVTKNALHAEIRSKDELKHVLNRERDTLELQRRSSYCQLIALAQSEWSANNLSRMEALLEQCPADLRGWEWHYLKRLRHSTPLSLRHESPVLDVAFSPDGERLATGTQAGIVRIWTTKTGQELQQWPAHRDNATSVAFSSDGRYVATGGWDQTVKVWDVEKVLQGEVDEPLLRWEHNSRVWSVSFSPDGERLASAGGKEADEKGEVKVWDIDTGEEALTLSSLDPNRPIRCVRFSPDGRQLAACGQDAIQLWDAQTGREQLTWHNHQRVAQAVAYSPDGRRLASVGGLLAVHPDQEVKVWNTRTGQETLSLPGHVGGLRSVAYSPDGRRLASAGLDQTIKLWDAVTGQEVLTLRGHRDNIFCVAFSADGYQLASGSVDSTVRIWDATHVEREPTPEHLTLRGHTGAVTDVAFHPTDGRSLVSADTDGKVRMWDFWSGKALGTLPGSSFGIRLRVAYSPDGRHLAAVGAGPNQPVRVWDMTTLMETRPFRGHIAPPLCLAFSPDGGHVASAGYDFIVRVWDVTTAEEVETFTDHNWPIFAVTFSPDGRLIASGSGDSTVRIRDRVTGAELPTLQHAGRVTSVAFSGDGELLASASWDRTVKVWDTKTWKLLHDLSDPTGAAQCVTFGSDSRRIAWGSTDGTVKVWDGPGTATHSLRGHTSWVQGVAFSRDGKWIASASLDGSVKIWQAPPQTEVPARDAGERENEGGAWPEED